MRHGWFAIDNLQSGDRTLAEQMLGVTPALAEAKGKTLLDLGCAEALIGREFARAGAVLVHGIDSVRAHLDMAAEQCRDWPMTFELADLQTFTIPQPERRDIKQYDIVLSLGIVHKMRYPGNLIRYSARAGLDLVIQRMNARGEAADGILRSKHFRKNTCNVNEIMEEEGFILEQLLPGPREETTVWWRRI